MKKPAVSVSLELLNLLFDEFDIWQKIKDGRLTSVELRPYPSKAWTNATSLIIKHFLGGSKHVATTHCIRDGNGVIVHWDAKDIHFSQVCLTRE